MFSGLRQGLLLMTTLALMCGVVLGQSPGTIEFESGAYAVNEQASYRTVKVLRVGGAAGQVTVGFSTSDGTASASADYMPTQGVLAFAEGETEKAVTVQINNDTTVEPNETFSLTLTPGSGTLGTLTTAVFTINDSPTIGTIATQATLIGIPTAAIPFSVGDSETAAGDLVVSAQTSNPLLLPAQGIVFGGAGDSRTLTLSPVPALTGTATVTLLVTDAGGAVAVRAVTLNVGTSLAMPVTVPDVVLTADESFTLNYTLTNASWVTAVSRGNTTLFNTPGTGSTSDLRTQPTSGGTARTLRIRPSDRSTSAGLYGTSTVTLGFTGTDAPPAQTFNVRVNPRAVADNNLLGIPGTQSTFDVLANDCVPLAGHVFTITSVSNPANGVLEIVENGALLRYTPAQTASGFDTFTYTVTVSSSDEFNGYQFSGIGSVKIGGYVVVDSPTASQHIDLDFDYINGTWSQVIRTDAVVGGSVQSGTFSPTVLDADEGVLFFDPSTKQPRPATALLDVLGVPAGADVWVGPSSSNGHKLYLGIANESTTGVETYLPEGDPRAASNSDWVATRLVRFSGPGHMAAFSGSLCFDTMDGVNSPGDAASGGNVSDTFWGLSGSHAHPTWYFTAPGRYALTFQTTVKAGGAFVTSPETTFYVDVEYMAGNTRLGENPPQALQDVLSVAEDGAAGTVVVISNDTSAPDGYEALRTTAVGPAAHGTTALSGDGRSVSYTPSANFVGSDSFNYTVTDEHGGSAMGTVQVTVTPMNDMPSFVKGGNTEHAGAATGLQTFPAWATAMNDGDPEVVQALSFQVNVVGGATIFSTPPAVSSDGTLSYSLNGVAGVATVEVRITDDATAGGDALTSAPQTFTVYSASSSFTLTALGTLGGVTSFALDVNNLRQVSGNSLVTSDPGSTGSLLRAYLWTAGVMKNLGSMPPIPPSTSTNRFGRGYAVNDAGVVVGEYNNDSSRAFVYQAGAMAGLIRLAGDTDGGVALDINNSNVIVGSSSNGTVSKATRWTFNGATFVASDLGTIAGTASATGRAAAINDAGAVAGQSTNSSGTTQATLWNAGAVINLTSLGNGTRFSQAFGLNENLEVVGASSTGQTVGELIGTSSTTSITRAFVWRNGVMTELPPFNLYTPTNNGTTTNYHSVANDINESGLVVGNSQRISGSPAVATLWKDGVPMDLNSLLPPGSGWVLTNAESINDRGDIAGTGTFGGASRAFLLKNASVNDLPSFAKGADIEHIGGNTGAKSFPSWATQIDDGDVEVQQVLNFQATVVAGASIFAIPPTVSPNGTLNYTLSGSPGVATIEVRLTDDLAAGGEALTSAPQTFTIASFSLAQRRIIGGVHADAIAVFGEEGGLILGAMADVDGQSEVRLDPDEVTFHVEEATRTVVPAGAEYAFLGTAGADVWIAPQDQPAGAVLWPGVSTEGVPPGFVNGDQIALRLESVSGPGVVNIYQTEAGNQPVRRLSSTGSDFRTWTLGSDQHMHANWAFSAPGTYSLTFSARATINGTQVSSLQTYTFLVGDFPSAVGTSTGLAINPAETEVGNPVSMVASLSPAGALGYVEFLKGSTVLGQKVVNAGKATFTTSDLGVGTHALTARFVPGRSYDFAPSASPAVTATIVEPGGLPFSIVGVESGYTPGQVLNAQVVGYTLQPGQSFRWDLRVSPSQEIPLLDVTGSLFSRVVTPALDGMELGVKVFSNGTQVAQTPWVPLVVAHDGVRPTITRVDSLGDAVLPGDNGIQFAVTGRSLAPGESIRYVALLAYPGLGQALEYQSFASSTVSSLLPVVQQSNTTLVVNRSTVMGTTPIQAAVAAQVVRDGSVVAQSLPVWLDLPVRLIQITGVPQIYRQGATLEVMANVSPVRPSDILTYTWEFSKNSVISVWGQPQQSSASLVQPNMTVAAHDGGRLILKLYNHGVLVDTVGGSASPTIRVTDDLTGQVVLLNSLAAHYHQGEAVNLGLIVDPLPLPADELLWQWKWPGGDDWMPFPGVSGLGGSLVAEQALDGVQVRALLDFAAEGVASVPSQARTIFIDDHGAAARQKPTVSGSTSYALGAQVTLTRVLPANGPTLLTMHRWERKGAGASHFTTVPGQTGEILSFTASGADDGAQYRVSIMKPDGRLAYGPSPAVTLDVQSSRRLTFAEGAYFGNGSGSGSNVSVLADFDEDDIPDLVTASGSPGGLRFVKGSGAGTFAPQGMLDFGSAYYTGSLFTGDYDGDGDADLISTEFDLETLLGSATNGRVTLWWNNGAAEFTQQVLLASLAYSATHIDVADVNGDSRADILHSTSPTTMVWMAGLQGGAFAAPVTLHSAFTALSAIETADRDGDGDADILAYDSAAGQFVVFTNQGAAEFSTPVLLTAPASPAMPRPVDVNQDGLLDLVVTQGSSPRQALVYVQQDGGDYAQAMPVAELGNDIYNLAFADLNGDGLSDVLSVSYSTASAYMLRWSPGRAEGGFGAPRWVDSGLSFVSAIHVRDLDADGDLDIALATSASAKAVAVYLNNSNENPVKLIAPAPRAYVLGDKIQVGVHFGQPVIVTGTPRIALQVGSNTAYVTYEAGSGTSKLLFGYLVGPSDIDLDGAQLQSPLIELNGGGLKDALDGDAPVALPGELFEGVLVNGAGALVESITRLDATPTNAPWVRFGVAFNAVVQGVDVNDFELVMNAGPLTGAAIQSVTGSGSNYVVTVTTGQGSGALALRVKGDGGITNGASVPLAKPYSGGEVYTLRRGMVKPVNTFYSSGHADYRPVLQGEEFSFGVHGAPGLPEFVASDSVITYAGSTAIVTRPAGAAYNFLGVQEGASMHVMNSSGSVPTVPYLGFSGESVPAGIFARYLNTDPRINATNAYMKVQMADMRSSTGGDISIYSISSGNPRVWMASSDGVSGTDAFFLRPGSHSHYNVTFSKPGVYEVDIFVSGYRDSNGNGTYDAVNDPYVESGIFTMIFGVDFPGGQAPVALVQDMTGRAPLAGPDSFAFDIGSPITGNVLANDADPQQDPLTALIKSQPARGVVELSPDGVFNYTPAVSGFIGSDSFVYYVHDGKGGWSEARAEIRVTPLRPQEPMRPGESIGLTVSAPPGGRVTVTGLPPGLTYNSRTNSITGRPRTEGTYLLSIQIRDAQGRITTTLVPLVVQGLPTEIVGAFTGYISGLATGGNLERCGGRFDLTVTSMGSYTLKVGHGLLSSTHSGFLDLSQAVPRVVVSLRNGYLLTLNLAGGAITGAATSGAVTLPVEGWRSIYDARLNRALKQQGHYTVGMEQLSTQTGHPAGHGFLSVKIGADGKTIVTGKTADGSAVTCSGFLGGDNRVLVHTQLYGKQGGIAGALALSLDSTGGYIENSLVGRVHWAKPTVLKGRTSMESGFALPLECFGKYMSADGKGLILGLPAPEAVTRLHFQSPALGSMSPSVANIKLAYPSMKTLIPSNPTKTTLVVGGSTGALSGTFTLVDGTAKRSGIFHGMLVRDGSGAVHGVGFTLLPMLPLSGQPAAQTQLVSGAVEWRAD